MSRIIELIRRVVRQELAGRRDSLLGVVTAATVHTDKDDENNYEANVRLKHEDLELRKVPLAAGHMGMAAPPKAGDLVLVQFVNGDLNQPLITGRFYHADERPPLHRQDDILFEQRVAADGTLNHLRFTPDGAIYLQRDVKKPEDNSDAKTSVKIDGASGSVEIKAGGIVITLKHDDSIEIVADGKPVGVTCDTLTVKGNLTVDKGELKVMGNTGSTTINGNEITGG